MKKRITMYIATRRSVDKAEVRKSTKPRTWRRVCAALLCTAMLTGMMPAVLPGQQSYATEESSRLTKRAELVVFIRFKGEPEFVSGTSTNPVVTLLDGSQINLNEWYNAQDTNRATDPSLNQFVQKVSYNGVMTKPIYASPDAAKIVSYECSANAKDADFNDTDWFEGIQVEALKAVEQTIPKEAILDYNYDGKIDNCMFLWGPTRDNVVEYWLKAGDGSRPWQWVLGRNKTQICGKTADLYVRNFIYSKNTFMSTGQAFSKQILMHEYMHTLGTDDLYSDDEWYTPLIGSSFLPVGDWDIQSNHSKYGSSLLYQRVENMGFGTYGEIKQNGRYTLYDVNEPKPANGINGYKIPTSDPKQYFVIEYRRGATDGAAAAHGDGIIVYRVDMNKDVKEDVHIFGKVAGFNSSANIADSKNGIGNGAVGTIIGNNSLEYTNGKNSGICIRNVSSAGETISFDVYL